LKLAWKDDDLDRFLNDSTGTESHGGLNPGDLAITDMSQDHQHWLIAYYLETSRICSPSAGSTSPTKPVAEREVQVEPDRMLDDGGSR
jgi:hypothetical protein